MTRKTNRFGKIAVFFSTVVFIGSVLAQSSHAKTCNGIDVHSGIKLSMRFLGGKKARVCIARTCSSGTFSGSPKSSIEMRGPRIVLRAKKRSYGYLFYYQTGKGNGYVKLKC